MLIDSSQVPFVLIVSFGGDVYPSVNSMFLPSEKDKCLVLALITDGTDSGRYKEIGFPFPTETTNDLKRL